MVCEQSHIKVPTARFARFAHKLAFSTLMWLCSQTICLSAYHKNLSEAVPPNPRRCMLTNLYPTYSLLNLFTSQLTHFSTYSLLNLFASPLIHFSTHSLLHLFTSQLIHFST